MFLNWVAKPELAAIRELNSKSLERLSYTSAVKVILCLNKPRSRPILALCNASHFKPGLGKLVKATPVVG
ncbi:hypothetical protein D3C85_1027940 [compost metagenome]